LSNLYRGVLNTLPYKSSFGLHIYGNVYRGPISYHISRSQIFTRVVFFVCDEISGRTSGNKQKAAANLVPCDFAPLQVWRWCNRIKWAACMQIIYAARQSNSESQARYRVHVPKEALHFPLSVPRIWIYSSESRANNRLSAQVYLSSCCCWCGGCVPKIVPAPISEHVLFKFNEKEAARLCDKFRIRWRETRQYLHWKESVFWYTLLFVRRPFLSALVLTERERPRAEQNSATEHKEPLSCN
jgi:predicted DNA-binding protein (UPF0251 family)